MIDPVQLGYHTGQLYTMEHGLKKAEVLAERVIKEGVSKSRHDAISKQRILSEMLGGLNQYIGEARLMQAKSIKKLQEMDMG